MELTHLNALNNSNFKYVSGISSDSALFLSDNAAKNIEDHFSNFREGLCPCEHDPTEICPCEDATIVDYEPLVFTDESGNYLFFRHVRNGEFVENIISIYDSRQSVFKSAVHKIKVLRKGKEVMTITLPDFSPK